MLTVPEAARRTGRNPETIRRWIRAGKLPAQRVGTQHLIDELDLAAVAFDGESAPLPKVWQRTWTGEAQIDWVGAVRQSRREH